MSNTRMMARFMLVTIILTTARMMNGRWTVTNLDHFCEKAQDCINEETGSFTGLEDNDLNSWKAEQVCETFETCGTSLESTEKVFINTDNNKFCRIVIDCYGGMFMISPEVDIDKWCPFARFCDHTPASHVKEYDIRYSCCKHCSCDPSCGLTNDCCYYNNNNNNNNNNSTTAGMLHVHDIVQREGLKCIELGRRGKHYKRKSVYIKDSCSNGTKCLDTNETIIPAASHSKQRLYINENCARCNEVDDVKSWLAYRICSDGTGSTGCYVTTEPDDADDNAWMTSFSCPSTVINTCHPRYKNEAVKKSCDEVNAEVSLFQHDTNILLIFANIFCMACNFYTNYNPKATCDIYDKDFEPSRAPNAFAMLLDLDTKRKTVTQGTPSTGAGIRCGAFMVKNVAKPGCRPMYCPEEKARMEDGSCKHLAKLWLYGVFVLQIRLVPYKKTRVPATILRSTSQESTISNWLTSPCLSWTDNYVVFLLTRPESQNELVREIVIEIISKAKDVKPAEFMSVWAKCFGALWKVVLGAHRYAFSPSFYTSSYNPPIESEGRTNVYERIYKDEKPTYVNRKITKVIINKLDYCDQVDVYVGEYELEFDVGNLTKYSSIRLLHNNVTLGNNEFHYMPSNIMRICVENYQFNGYSHNSGGTQTWSCCIMALVILLYFTLQFQ